MRSGRKLDKHDIANTVYVIYPIVSNAINVVILVVSGMFWEKHPKNSFQQYITYTKHNFW